MEALFSTPISVDGNIVNYHVVFDHEAYTFNAEDGRVDPAAFSIRREHDEWHPDGAAPQAVSDQAIKALDQFLLQQH